MLKEEFDNDKVIPYPMYGQKDHDGGESDESESAGDDEKKADEMEGDVNEKINKVEKKKKHKKPKPHKAGENGQIALSMQQLFLNMCTELQDCWLDMLFHAQGSFCMRRILEVLGGKVKFVAKSDQVDALSNGTRRGNQVPAEEGNASAKHVKKLRKSLNSIVGCITSCSDKEIVDLFYHQFASPVLQVLIETVGRELKKKKQVIVLECLLSRCVLWVEEKADDDAGADSDEEGRVASNGDDDAVEDSTEEQQAERKRVSSITTRTKWRMTAGSNRHVLALLKDKYGSHLLEKVVEFATPRFFSLLYTLHFEGQLVALSGDRIANHVVQKLLGRCYLATELEACITELKDHLYSFLCNNTGGVVWQLVGASCRLGAKQTLLLKTLSVAMNEKTGGDNKKLVAALLECGPMQGRAKFSFMGSLVVQAMMGFSPQSAAVLLHSFQSLSTEYLVSLAQDPTGSRVVEAYLLKGPASFKEKKKFVLKLEGKFADVACHSCGSFFVEKCFHFGDLPVKSAICHDLASNERQLTASGGGAKVLLLKCKVALFKKQPKVWEEEIKNRNSKADIFADILGGSGVGSSSSKKRSYADGAQAADGSHRDGKKKKRGHDENIGMHATVERPTLEREERKAMEEEVASLLSTIDKKKKTTEK